MSLFVCLAALQSPRAHRFHHAITKRHSSPLAGISNISVPCAALTDLVRRFTFQQARIAIFLHRRHKVQQILLAARAIVKQSTGRGGLSPPASGLEA